MNVVGGMRGAADTKSKEKSSSEESETAVLTAAEFVSIADDETSVTETKRVSPKSM